MYNQYFVLFPDPMSLLRMFLQHEILHFYPLTPGQSLFFSLGLALMPLYFRLSEHRQPEMPPLCCLGAGLKLS